MLYNKQVQLSKLRDDALGGRMSVLQGDRYCAKRNVRGSSVPPPALLTILCSNLAVFPDPYSSVYTITSYF